MNWYKVFYWITVADNFKMVTGILTVVFGLYILIASAAALGLFQISWSDWRPSSRRLYLIILIAGLFNVFAWVLTPSKKDMIVIISGGAIGNFVTTDSSTKALPAEAMNYLRNYIKKNADELDYDTKKDLNLTTPKDDLLDKVKSLTKEEIIDYLKKDTLLIK